MTIARHLADSAATRELGCWLGARVRPGDVVLLDGPLGAGKTTLVRALVEELGGDPAMVASPTFTLMNCYDARFAIAHVDAYRLEHPGQLAALGFDELVEDGLGVIEWADRVETVIPPACAWRVRLAHVADGRQALIDVPPGRSAG
jgi:tRNA threonylcarbamoyl adenosine modification protein YjeE